jgi:antitoxin component YwqK of YwqJK toxin-antitoxin module
MRFPKDILQYMTKYINDANTFKSWALLCKRTANECRYLSNMKKEQFSKKKTSNSKCFTIIFSYLPNGFKHGFYSQWYNNGVVRKKGVYKDGYKTGYWEFRYYTGIVRSKGFYYRGKKDGPWIQIKPNGRPSQTVVYKNGIVVKQI